MSKLLNDYLQPSSTIVALEAAQRLDSLFPTHRSDEDQPEGEPREPPESFLLHLWPLILYTAAQIPHDHPSQERLAELVKNLRGLVSKTPVVYIDGCETKLWGDLPSMFWIIWEEIERKSLFYISAQKSNVVIRDAHLWRRIQAKMAKCQLLPRPAYTGPYI